MAHNHKVKTSVGEAVEITICVSGVHIKVVTIAIAATKMGYSRRHVQNLCEWKKLIAIKVSGIWFVHEHEIITYRQSVRRTNKNKVS